MRDCESEGESERVRSGSQLLSDIQTFFMTPFRRAFINIKVMIKKNICQFFVNPHIYLLFMSPLLLII